MKWVLHSFWYDLWEKVLGETYMEANYIRWTTVRYRK